MIKIKTEDLVANVEKKIEFTGGSHLKVKNLGDDTVYLSQHNNIIIGADDVKSIQSQTTDIVTDVATYSIENGTGDYRGTIYALAIQDCQIELEATNNPNFKQNKRGGGGISESTVKTLINDSFYVDGGYLVMPNLSVATDTNNAVSLDYAFASLNDVTTESI